MSSPKKRTLLGIIPNLGGGGGRGDLFLKFFKRREKSKTFGEGKYFRGGEGKEGGEGEEKVGKYLVSRGEEEQRRTRRKI